MKGYRRLQEMKEIADMDEEFPSSDRFSSSVFRAARLRIAGNVALSVVLAAAVGVGGFVGLRALGARNEGFIDPASTADPDGPVTASGGRDGVVVTLTFDKGEYAPGEVAWAHVRVENRGDRAAAWEAGGCRQPADIEAWPASFSEPGREWSGVAAEAKQLLLRNLRERGGFPFLSKAVLEAERRGEMMGCTADSVIDLLKPGAAEEIRLGWDTSGWPPGVAEVRASFPYYGRTDSADAGSFYERGIPTIDPITASASIRLVGSRPAFLSPAEAIDVALARERLMRWLEKPLDSTLETIFGYRAMYLEEKKKWHIALNRHPDDPSMDEADEYEMPIGEEATVEVDALSGNILEFEIGEAR